MPYYAQYNLEKFAKGSFSVRAFTILFTLTFTAAKHEGNAKKKQVFVGLTVTSYIHFEPYIIDKCIVNANYQVRNILL